MEPELDIVLFFYNNSLADGYQQLMIFCPITKAVNHKFPNKFIYSCTRYTEFLEGKGSKIWYAIPP